MLSRPRGCFLQCAHLQHSKPRGAALVSRVATCIALLAAGSPQQKSHLRGMTYGALIVAPGVRGRSASPSITAACAANITRRHVHSPDQTLRSFFYTLRVSPLRLSQDEGGGSGPASTTPMKTYAARQLQAEEAAPAYAKECQVTKGVAHSKPQAGRRVGINSRQPKGSVHVMSYTPRLAVLTRPPRVGVAGVTGCGVLGPAASRLARHDLGASGQWRGNGPIHRGLVNQPRLCAGGFGHEDALLAVSSRNGLGASHSMHNAAASLV
jgi:hypothetical protein